jgi:quercetin dioxygenase-like cupin family protein
MTDNVWSIDGIVKKFYFGEDKLEDSDKKINYDFLSNGEYCTLNAVQIVSEKGIPLHYHKEHDEIIQIIEGEGEAIIANSKYQLKKGNLFFTPKKTPHALLFPCIILLIYTPTFDMDNPDRVFL